MSGRSSWCFTGDHPGCRYAACSCACHEAAAALPAVPAQPVPAGTQAEIRLPDGLDGSTDDVATVAFSLRGQGYQVDLSAEHRRALEAALAPFLAVARLVASSPIEK